MKNYMKIRNYVLDGHTPVPVDDLIGWAKWFETADRTVSKTALVDPNGKEIVISTVFLGLDHSYTQTGDPILFETMVFGEHYDEQQRYSTWEQAEEGHRQMVEAFLEVFRLQMSPSRLL